jgi:adenylylsulfate kinase-like enzyme
MIIQIIGLPGSGKTTLAKELVKHLGALHLNADEVRDFVNYDLGFSHEDRIEHSRRLGGMARLFQEQGKDVVVDFVCPTLDTRKAFGDADVVVFMDRVQESIYKDTNLMWQRPDNSDVVIPDGLSVQDEVKLVLDFINN